MKAEQLRKSILQLAIQGKLVPQDPNDEPASVLLERIRAEKQRLIKEGKIKKDKNDSVIFKGDDNRHYEKVGSEVKDITDDLPFEIPNNWVWCRLNDIIILISGTDLSPDKYNSNNKGIPYITGASNFINSILNINRWTEHPTTISDKGDLLITCKGTIGEMAYNNVGVIHIARQVMAIRSLYHFVSYIRILLETYITSLKKAAKSMIPGISRQDILQCYFPLPPLAEQVRIVAEIEKFEPLIAEYDKLERQATKLDDEIYDKLKKSILQYAIQGKLVPQDPNDEPASVLLERIRAEKKAKLGKKYVDSYIYKGDDNCYYEKVKDSAKEISEEIPFEIPGSWRWIRVDNLFQHNTGKALNSSNTQGVLHLYITTSNVYWGCFNLEHVKEMPFTQDEFEKCSIVPGDLLVCEGGDVGRAAIWEKDIPMCIQNHIHRLRAYYPVCTAFYYFSFFVYKSIGLIGGKGIGIQGLSSGALGKLIFPLLPLAEQERIVKQVKIILEKLKDEA